MGSLRHSCAKVRESPELRFGVVRGVGRGIGDDAACSQITLGNLVIIINRLMGAATLAACVLRRF